MSVDWKLNSFIIFRAFRAWSEGLEFSKSSGQGSSDTPPIAISPVGEIDNSSVAFRWRKLDGIKFYEAGIEINGDWSSSIEIPCIRSICEFGPRGPFSRRLARETPTGVVTWWVRGKNADGTWGPWNDGLDFTVNQ